MIEKEINPFDECAARCVHLFPQEEECTSSSWGTMKCRHLATANSQRMLTEISKSGTIAEIRIWVESDTIKH